MATVNITDENIEQLIEDSELLVIDFWAAWCGPCKMFGPIFEKVSEKFDDVVFAKCDTEAAQDVAAAFGIRSIPTLAVFREKILLFKESGAFPEHLLEEVIGKIKSLDMSEVRATLAEEEAKEADAAKDTETE